MSKLTDRAIFNRIAMRIAAPLLAAAVGACASYDGRGIVPGKSTAADVEQVMGQPAERIPGAAGDTVWFYPRNPFGRHTYAVSVAPDGRVRGIEQTLTMENMARIAAGNTARDVRMMMGPPYRVTRNHMGDREVWEYRMFNQIQIPYSLFVQYSLDGVVREVLFLRDPALDAPSPGRS